MREPVTAERLRELLHYDPETGLFMWVVSTSNRGRAGAVAGSNFHGYRCIGIDGHHCLSHRLVWLWTEGEWPKGEIDHINGDKADNRRCNLRSATRLENLANSVAHKDSTSGLKGVSWHKRRGKWRADINIKGKQRTLGLFDTREDAALTYSYAAYALFGEFARPQWRDLLGEMRGG